MKRKERSNELFNLSEKYFPKDTPLQNVPFAKDLANYNASASRITGETKNIERINELLSSRNKFLKQLNDITTARMFSETSPLASNTEQILTRKALPYAGMGIASPLSLGPVGFMGGILSAGQATSPKFWGGRILKHYARTKSNPELLTPIQQGIYDYGSRGIGNIYSLLLPQEQQER